MPAISASSSGRSIGCATQNFGAFRQIRVLGNSGLVHRSKAEAGARPAADARPGGPHSWNYACGNCRARCLPEPRCPRLTGSPQLLNRELNKWISLSEVQVAQLYQHYEMLLRWNQRMNLTTVEPGPETVIRHYCESLFFAAQLPQPNDRISVAGFGFGSWISRDPDGRPEASMENCLGRVKHRKVGLSSGVQPPPGNVSVVAERMEDTSAHGDWVVARAVDPVEVLSNIPRLAPNVGLMLGEDDFSSIRHHSHIAWADPVRLPWGDRRICVYGKCST